MRFDLRTFAACHDMTVDGGSIRVIFKNNRHHEIKVLEEESRLLLYGVALGAERRGEIELTEQGESIAYTLWQRNRMVKLVGFRLDEKGRIVGECWLPTAGLTKEEFQFCVRNLAVECDRLEFVLTGEDRL